MKDEIIAAISSKLKEIYPDGTIYLDSVSQLKIFISFYQ